MPLFKWREELAHFLRQMLALKPPKKSNNNNKKNCKLALPGVAWIWVLPWSPGVVYIWVSVCLAQVRLLDFGGGGLHFGGGVRDNKRPSCQALKSSICRMSDREEGNCTRLNARPAQCFPDHWTHWGSRLDAVRGPFSLSMCIPWEEILRRRKQTLK